MKIQKKNGGCRGVGSGCQVGGQGGCERRIEVFWEDSQKINSGGGGRVGGGSGWM